MYPLCEIILISFTTAFLLFLSFDWRIACFVIGWKSALWLKVSDSKGKVIHPTLPICASLVVSPFQTAVMLAPPGIKYWRVWRRWKLIGGICLHAWSRSSPQACRLSGRSVIADLDQAGVRHAQVPLQNPFTMPQSLSWERSEHCKPKSWKCRRILIKVIVSLVPRLNKAVIFLYYSPQKQNYSSPSL